MNWEKFVTTAIFFRQLLQAPPCFSIDVGFLDLRNRNSVFIVNHMLDVYLTLLYKSS